jgi:hypothetical protein
VAKIEDDIPNPDDVTSPDDMLSPDETLTPLEETAPEAASVPAEEEPVAASAEPAKSPAAAVDDELAPEAKPPYVAIAVCIGVLVVLFALAYFKLFGYSTAIYVIGLAIIPLMLLLGRKTATVYTVLLGCVLAALMTSVYCLWSVLERYHGDVKAQAAKQGVSMTQPLDRNTMHS